MEEGLIDRILAILRTLELMNDGYECIADLDLEKFFDTVPQDKLVSYVGRVIHDADTESTRKA